MCRRFNSGPDHFARPWIALVAVAGFFFAPMRPLLASACFSAVTALLSGGSSQVVIARLAKRR
jgi:hypothetical protein